MTSNFQLKLQEAFRLEKIERKRQLREDIAHGRSGRVFAYCTGQSKKAKQAMLDQVLFGQSTIEVTTADAQWVLRYWRRLMGRPAK